MPAAMQDLSLVVDREIPASDIERALVEGAGELLESISLFDRYENLGEGKISLTFAMTFRASDRTLTADEVTGYREAALARASELYGARARS